MSSPWLHPRCRFSTTNQRIAGCWMTRFPRSSLCRCRWRSPGVRWFSPLVSPVPLVSSVPSVSLISPVLRSDWCCFRSKRMSPYRRRTGWNRQLQGQPVLRSARTTNAYTEASYPVYYRVGAAALHLPEPVRGGVGGVTLLGAVIGISLISRKPEIGFLPASRRPDSDR